MSSCACQRSDRKAFHGCCNACHCALNTRAASTLVCNTAGAESAHERVHVSQRSDRKAPHD